MFARALDGLGMPPSEVVHVGDNLVCDVEGAARAGIRPILMDYAGRHPDFPGERIADLRELEVLAGAVRTDLITSRSPGAPGGRRLRDGRARDSGGNAASLSLWERARVRVDRLAVMARR